VLEVATLVLVSPSPSGIHTLLPEILYFLPEALELPSMSGDFWREPGVEVTPVQQLGSDCAVSAAETFLVTLSVEIVTLKSQQAEHGRKLSKQERKLTELLVPVAELAFASLQRYCEETGSGILFLLAAALTQFVNPADVVQPLPALSLQQAADAGKVSLHKAGLNPCMQCTAPSCLDIIKYLHMC